MCSQVSKDLLVKIKNTILQRAVDGMQQEGAPYTGKQAGTGHLYSKSLLYLECIFSFL